MPSFLLPDVGQCVREIDRVPVWGCILTHDADVHQQATSMEEFHDVTGCVVILEPTTGIWILPALLDQATQQFQPPPPQNQWIKNVKDFCAKVNKREQMLVM